MSDRKPIRPFTAEELAILRECVFVRPLEAAALLGVSERTMRNLTTRGVIPSRGKGQLRRYAVRDLMAYQEGGER